MDNWTTVSRKHRKPATTRKNNLPFGNPTMLEFWANAKDVKAYTIRDILRNHPHFSHKEAEHFFLQRWPLEHQDLKPIIIHSPHTHKSFSSDKYVLILAHLFPHDQSFHQWFSHFPNPNFSLQHFHAFLLGILWNKHIQLNIQHAISQLSSFIPEKTCEKQSPIDIILNIFPLSHGPSDVFHHLIPYMQSDFEFNLQQFTDYADGLPLSPHLTQSIEETIRSLHFWHLLFENSPLKPLMDGAPHEDWHLILSSFSNFHLKPHHLAQFIRGDSLPYDVNLNINNAIRHLSDIHEHSAQLALL